MTLFYLAALLFVAFAVTAHPHRHTNELPSSSTRRFDYMPTTNFSSLPYRRSAGSSGEWNPNSNYENSGNLNILSRSNGVFSVKLYEALSEGNDNTVVSPLSVNYALTMLLLGAGGNTLRQLRTGLNQVDDERAIVSAYRAFTDSLQNDPELSVVSKMYVDGRFKVKQQFSNQLTQNFGAEVENVDFSTQPEQTRNAINSFVKSKTNNLIPELLEQGAVDSDTASLIVNTVYFKSNWKYGFNKGLSHKASFHGANGIGSVDMMVVCQHGFKYVNDQQLNAEIIELPYQNGYSFMVVLPKDKNGINEVENKIKARSNDPNSSPFEDIFKNAQVENIEVHIPNFKFEQTHDLRGPLYRMGMKDMFGSEANFQRMAENGVYVSKVFQKAVIRVYEDGTEAAAATGIAMSPMSLMTCPPSSKVFKANRPFLYAIKHKSSQTPLFIGRFASP